MVKIEVPARRNSSYVLEYDAKEITVKFDDGGECRLSMLLEWIRAKIESESK